MKSNTITNFSSLPSKEELAKSRLEALAMLNPHNQKKVLATVTAGNKKESWPVRIEQRNGYFSINGRWTSLDLYLFETPFGYLVSVPNYNRSGYVPADCSSSDVVEYVQISNHVDATTLSVGIRWLIENGYVQKHHPAEKSLYDHIQQLQSYFKVRHNINVTVDISSSRVRNTYDVNTAINIAHEVGQELKKEPVFCEGDNCHSWIDVDNYRRFFSFVIHFDDLPADHPQTC